MSVVIGRRSNKGFTLLEVTVAAGIIAILAITICGVWIGTIWSFDRTTSQTIADSDAVIAMQHIIADVREAKLFQFPTSSHLRIILPVTNPDLSYNRVVPDTDNPIDYFLSDHTGQQDHTGTWLWRKEGNNSLRAVAHDIHSVHFESDTPLSLSCIRITITASKKYAHGEAQTQLTERVVYLRNY